MEQGPSAKHQRPRTEPRTPHAFATFSAFLHFAVNGFISVLSSQEHLTPYSLVLEDRSREKALARPSEFEQRVNIITEIKSGILIKTQLHLQPQTTGGPSSSVWMGSGVGAHNGYAIIGAAGFPARAKVLANRCWHQDTIQKLTLVRKQ